MKSPSVRIKWRDFVKTRAHAFVGFVLRIFNYQLVIEFNAEQEATDVYIVKKQGDPAVSAPTG